MLYWLGLTIIIGLVTVGMWQSSVQRTFLNRLQAIPKSIGKAKLTFALGIVIWLGSGAFIYRQTNIIGDYRSKQAMLDWRINYEKKYAALKDLPQPIIKAIKTKVDLLTKEGMYLVEGTYQLKNETNKPISKVWVSLDRSVNDFEVAIPNGEKQEQDKLFNQQFILLKKPLAPNAQVTMRFKLKIIRDGFVPFNTENSLSSNGTYIELEKYVPHFGYNEGLAIEDKLVRKKAGLPVKAPMLAPSHIYHLIDLETTISTALDQ